MDNSSSAWMRLVYATQRLSIDDVEKLIRLNCVEILWCYSVVHYITLLPDLIEVHAGQSLILFDDYGGQLVW